MNIKKCPKCNQLLPIENFYKRKNGTPRSWCKECNKSCAKDFYKKNPDYNRLKSKDWYEKNKNYMANYRKQKRQQTYITESSRKYNIGKDDVIKLLEIKSCEICGRSIDFDALNVHEKPNIDHCHQTGRVRGVLCGYCNNMLGRCFDDVSILDKAIRYLNERG